MERSERVRRAVVLSLNREIVQGAGARLPARWLSEVVGVFGWGGVAVSLLESFKPHLPIWAISLLGIGGGLAVCLAIWLRQMELKWPVVSEFLDPHAIERAADEYKT